MQKIFFRIERFPSERSSLFGIFTVHAGVCLCDGVYER